LTHNSPQEYFSRAKLTFPEMNPAGVGKCTSRRQPNQHADRIFPEIETLTTLKMPASSGEQYKIGYPERDREP
jgi:hypothetical protein